jgi:hypothetical protein
MKNRLESRDISLIGPETRYRDYLLQDYKPARRLSRGLHPSTILRWALGRESLGKAVLPMLSALQSGLGHDETVWGIKYGSAGFSVEFYFYNKSRNAKGSPKSVARVRKIVAPYFRLPAVDETQRYFMFSFELSASAPSAEPGPLLYFDADNAGYSYRAHPGRQYRLENHYSFYEARQRRDVEALAKRLRLSPRGAAHVDELLPAHLVDCHNICHAVKPLCDGLYFSRITSQQTAIFLKEREALPLASLLKRHDSEIPHLWDVGFNYTSTASGKLLIDRFGLYGPL